MAVALRRPIGRYVARRASQLAGVPRTTLYDWARNDVLAPDFKHERPMQWSYRDLVYLRMLAWLRSNGMPREWAAERVGIYRTFYARGAEDWDVEILRTDGKSILEGLEPLDAFTGQALLGQEFVDFFSEFRLVMPVDMEDLGSKNLWGPDLLRPSLRIAIDPQVMAGEPCILETRIPTSTLYALETSRGLSPSQIVALYPGSLEEQDVVEASKFERSLSSHQNLLAA